MPFQVGQKLLCIRDTERLENWELVLPHHVLKDEVYTVRSLHFEKAWPDEYGIRFEELVNPDFNWDELGEVYEWSFHYKRFRALDDFEQKLVKTSRELEPA